MSEINDITITFNWEEINRLSNEDIIDFPVVYLLSNEKQLYVGESVKVKNRMKEHMKNPERKTMEKITIIGNKKFNRSATYNIETNLINYFIADEEYSLQNKSQVNSMYMHNYYEKDYYNKELFYKIWEKLKELKYTYNSLDYLSNKDIYKISPYKELSFEQYVIKQSILQTCEDCILNDDKFVFLIDGEAGTGKSVVISSVYNTLQDLTKDKTSNIYKVKSKNYLLVNHSEMLKTYKSLAKKLPNLYVNKMLKPTKFINDINEDNDDNIITIVDEAHLLLTKKDLYNNFKQDNQLEEIIKRSKVTIIIFDSKQSLKIKSMWDKQLLSKYLKNIRNEELVLKEQFRVNASEKILDWMDKFYNKKLEPIPNDDNFELKIFADALEMHEEIKKKNNEYGLSRMVSTFDYLHKKDGNDYFVEEGEFKLPWNKTRNNEKVTWAEIPETINEVGSIYTIQGFDLNFVGVILGPSIKYNSKRNELYIDTSLYKDVEAFRGSKEFANAEELKERIILNSINVLIKRGIRGLYIYASDDSLRNKLLELNLECRKK